MLSRLTIRDFLREDVGVYKCVCKNEVTNGRRDRVEGSVYLNMVSGEKEGRREGGKHIC